MDQIMMMDIQQQLLPPPPWYGVVAFLTIFFFTSLFRRCQSTSVSSTFLFSFLWVLTAQERLCRVLSYFQRGTLFPFRFGVKMTQKDATCTLLVLFLLLLLPPIMTEVKENPQQQQVSGDKLTTGRLSMSPTPYYKWQVSIPHNRSWHLAKYMRYFQCNVIRMNDYLFLLPTNEVCVCKRNNVVV